MSERRVSQRTEIRRRARLRRLNLDGRVWDSSSSSLSVSSDRPSSSQSNSSDESGSESSQLAEEEEDHQPPVHEHNDQPNEEDQEPHDQEQEEADQQHDEYEVGGAVRTSTSSADSETEESIPEDVENERRESESGSEQDTSDNLNDSEDSDSSSQSDSDDVGSNDEVNNDSENETDNSGDESSAGEQGGNDDPPLYRGAPITVAQSILAILTLALTHHLTGACIADVLTLISLHCINTENCVKTLHCFKNHFQNVGRKVLIFHYYCEGCLVRLDSKTAICEGCEGIGKISHFIELPLLGQLQAMFQRPGFYQKLQFRFNRPNRNPQNIEDIYDGEIYKSHFENEGFLSNPNNISFMWYTDGISLFNKSSFSIWPIYLVINELSYKERIKKENMILLGIWFGYRKPHCNLFLEPFEATLGNFALNGYQLPVAGQQEPITVRGKLLCGTCDLQAKSLFLRLKYTNGFFGCPRCKSPGQRHPARNTTVHVWPYTRQMALRENHEMPRYAEAVTQRGVPIFGVYGLSRLFFMMPDMIRGTGIDVMHGGFLGVSKLLTKLWFSPTYSGEPFSLSQYVDLVDERLRKIRPPSFVQRMPKLIKKKLAFWKALEYKLWLLCYSIPVLLGIMNDEYMHHHMALVSAISLLSQESVTDEQIRAASNLLHFYVSRFSDLYGLRFLGINVHQLLHLPDVVRDLGPLHVYSCFFLEDLNGQLVKLVHGTQYTATQLSAGASVFLNLSNWIDLLPPNSDVKRFCLNLINVKKRYKIAEVVSPKLYALGTYKMNVPVNVKRSIQVALDVVGGHYQQFYRLKKSGVLMCSNGYTRSTKKLSSYVLCMINNRSTLCRLDYLIRWSNCNCVRVCLCQPGRFICIATEFERIAWRAHALPNIRLSYMSKVQITNNVLIFDIDCIKSLCFFTSVENNENFIIEQINSLEAE